MTGSYTVRDHASMLTDDRRVSAFSRAMQAVIEPGSTVLEIGTGCGIFALHACELGAARVYAVEAENIYFVAREVVAQSPHADKVQLAHGMSTELSLPERVDVVLSDLHGITPLFGAHLTSIIDARTRHLKEGGALIPKRDSLWVAPVASPTIYKPYAVLASAPLGVDLRAALPYATSRWAPRGDEELELLAPPEKWADIDFATVSSPHLRGTAELIADRDDEAHGLSVWFDCTVGEGLVLSNRPTEPRLVYGSSFFPFPEPVPLVTGDHVAVRLGASLVEGDYVWRWETEITEASGRPKKKFRQDTFHAEPADAQRLRTRASEYVPHPTESSEVEQFILSSFDGEKTNEDIATELMTQFGDRFPSTHAALSRVAAAAHRHRTRATRLEPAPPRRTGRE